MFGPIVHFWCMRYEAKHQMFKRHAQVCCNFKNIPKTMARVHQITQCTVWQGHGLLRDEIEYKSGRTVQPHETLLAENECIKQL